MVVHPLWDSIVKPAIEKVGPHACVRFRRDLWETTVKPAMQKIALAIKDEYGIILDVADKGKKGKADRAECVEQMCRVINAAPMKEL